MIEFRSFNHTTCKTVLNLCCWWQRANYGNVSRILLGRNSVSDPIRNPGTEGHREGLHYYYFLTLAINDPEGGNITIIILPPPPPLYYHLILHLFVQVSH